MKECHILKAYCKDLPFSELILFTKRFPPLFLNTFIIYVPANVSMAYRHTGYIAVIFSSCQEISGSCQVTILNIYIELNPKRLKHFKASYPH